MRKYKLNEDYFQSIDSEEKAYWLGFIAADGCVYIDKNKKCRRSLNIELSIRDINLLKKFKKSLNSEHPIKINKKRNSCSLRISSKKIADDLIELGIVPRKTFVLKFPTIKKEYDSHFIRGYFDGDGCWYIRKDGGITFNIATASDKFRKEIKEILCKKLNFKYTKDNNIKVVYCGSRQSKRFYDFIYRNASVWLERKKNKVSKILENYKYVAPRPPKKSVIQYDFNFKKIFEFSGIREAEKSTGCDRKGIIQTCKGKQSHCGGFKWRYYDNKN